MYDVINQIISHVWQQGDSMQTYILYICSVLIPVLVASFIDLIYRVFRNFWRRNT